MHTYYLSDSMASIDPYVKFADLQREWWTVSLCAGRDTAVEQAQGNYIQKSMTDQLKDLKSVLLYDLITDPQTYRREPESWGTALRAKALLEFDDFKSQADPTGSLWPARIQEYVTFGLQLISSSSFCRRSTEDRVSGIGYIIDERPQPQAHTPNYTAMSSQ